jgi:hypothetical protein
MKTFLAATIYAATILGCVAAAAQSPIPPPNNDDSETAPALAAARDRGTRSAHTDIQRGIFRILDYGAPLPPDSGRRVDPQTHYSLESIGGCVVSRRFAVEVEAYNDAMRTWHARHKR